MRLRRSLTGVAVALGALLGPGPAAAPAHPLLQQAAPTPGLLAPRTPEVVRLALSEPVVARGSSVTLTTGPRRTRVPTTQLQVQGRTVTVRPRARLRSAVYHVAWSVLGADGHLVSGRFDFGVPGRGGAAPPGAERLAGASDDFRGADAASADGAVTVLGRWLGILAAAVLLGAFVLVARLRRRGAAGADRAAEALRDTAPRAWLLVALAAAEGVLAVAGSGPGGNLDLGLLTAGPTGRAALARAVVVAVVAAAALALGERRQARTRVLAGGAVAVLASYALSGHVLAGTSGWAKAGQVVHVLSASLWLGGALALALLVWRSGVRLADGARAFAPVAAASLAAAATTGVLAALREVDHTYFLRWSGYGRVVLVKSALVALVALTGAAITWRSRRAAVTNSPGLFLTSRRLLGLEGLGLLAVLALATTLSGLSQGRGRPLPAEQGTLFPGPAFATALLAGDAAQVGLAPARAGASTLTVSLPPEARAPRSVSARLACACAPHAVRATLQPGAGSAWSARVDLPRDGTWYAYLDVDGHAAAAPSALPVGVPHAAGAPALDVLAVADLSGPDAERCRAHELGLTLAVARINGDGGLDGGHKVAPLVLDSGGSVARARALVATRLGHGARPLAFAGGCGTGAAEAAAAAARAGVPALAGDPTSEPVATPGVVRVAADPYSQGLAMAQLVRQRVGETARPGAGGTLRVLLGDDADARRLAAGLRAGLQGSGYRLAAVAPGSLARATPHEVAARLSRTRGAAWIVDGPAGGGPDVAAIARAGRDVEGITPGPILLSERVLSERLVRSAGSLGRIGALQGLSEVSPLSKDGILYRQAVPLLYRGELASLDGLRGYVTGLALRDAVRDGASAGAIRRALLHPSVFSDALLSPWDDRRPGVGSPSVVAIQPQFLSPTLVPASVGGEAQDPSYFPDGTWTVTSGKALGLPPGRIGPALAG